MKYLTRYFIITAVFVFVGCSKEQSIKTNRAYLFVDTSGKEYKGFYTQPDLPKPIVGRSGKLIMSYENGQKWIEAEFADGQYHGIAKIWRLDGTLFAEEHYSHGVQHGKLTWWYPDEKKQMEVDWIDGKKNGLWVEWNNQGNESSRRRFKDDKPVE